MLEFEIIRWTVFIFLMLVFVLSFYGLPKNPDKQQDFNKAFIGAFLASSALALSIKLVLVVLFSKEIEKLLTLPERVYIVAGIVVVTYNACSRLPEYFDVSRIKEVASNKLKRLTNTKLEKVEIDDEESQGIVETDEAQADTEESE